MMHNMKLRRNRRVHCTALLARPFGDGIAFCIEYPSYWANEKKRQDHETAAAAVLHNRNQEENEHERVNGNTDNEQLSSPGAVSNHDVVDAWDTK